MSRILLAPMEGLADDVLRDVLTAVGGYDWAVCEFVRVSGNRLPARTFTRVCPELLSASRTREGTPVRVQLLGSDPVSMADNAARLVELAPAGVDLNFGCPAPTVNRHRGGAALLGEPELLFAIARAVRAVVPAGIPFTAKMRLGIDDPGLAVACAQALAAGGAEELVVHGRTKADGYRPPARWPCIDRVRAAIAVPVIANGEVWNQQDYDACRSASGCADVMLGRGAVADPFLARRLRGEPAGGWNDLKPMLGRFWVGVRGKVAPPHAPGRLKQWLGLLRRAYPEAGLLLATLRPVTCAREIDRLLAAAGIVAPCGPPRPLPLAA